MEPKKDYSNSTAGNAGVIILIITIALGGLILLFSDPSPDAYERNGNLMMVGTVFGLYCLLPLMLVSIFVYIIAIDSKKSNPKSDSSEKPEQNESNKN